MDTEESEIGYGLSESVSVLVSGGGRLTYVAQSRIQCLQETPCRILSS